MKKILIIFILSSFILNLIWENSQIFLYDGYTSFWLHFYICFIAALGDVIITLALFLLMVAITNDWKWIIRMNIPKLLVLILLSFITAILIEKIGLIIGRWKYNELMPIIPIIDVGLVPIIQMIIIFPILAYITQFTYNKNK